MPRIPKQETGEGHESPATQQHQIRPGGVCLRTEAEGFGRYGPTIAPALMSQFDLDGAQTVPRGADQAS